MRRRMPLASASRMRRSASSTNSRCMASVIDSPGEAAAAFRTSMFMRPPSTQGGRPPEIPPAPLPQTLFDGNLLEGEVHIHALRSAIELHHEEEEDPDDEDPSHDQHLVGVVTGRERIE